MARRKKTERREKPITWKDNVELIYGVKTNRPKPTKHRKPMMSRWLDENGKQVPL